MKYSDLPELLGLSVENHCDYEFHFVHGNILTLTYDRTGKVSRYKIVGTEPVAASLELMPDDWVPLSERGFGV